MSQLVLSLRGALPRRLDASLLTPDRLAGLKLREIERLPLSFEDGDAVAVGELFTVTGRVSPDLRLAGDLSRADGIGTGMSSGSLLVESNAGHRLGDAMSGGRLEVGGDAGDGVGREMRGGVITVRGRVGDGTGAGSPGSKRGMSGGEIIIFGDAGSHTGACMRRGTIAVGGTVGPGSLRAAIAGTLVAVGDVAEPAGRWSKRASLVAFSEITIPPTYEYSCTYRPGFVHVLRNHLRRRHGLPLPAHNALDWFKRYSGDMAEGGRGEILHALKF